jgi:hypothetical protein
VYIVLPHTNCRTIEYFHLFDSSDYLFSIFTSGSTCGSTFILITDDVFTASSWNEAFCFKGGSHCEADGFSFFPEIEKGAITFCCSVASF